MLKAINGAIYVGYTSYQTAQEGYISGRKVINCCMSGYIVVYRGQLMNGKLQPATIGT